MKYVPMTGWWEANASDFIPRHVFADEEKPKDTGLLDSSGVKLFRVPDPKPIGFTTLKEAA